jgi:SAM-dependent methyltransferase
VSQPNRAGTAWRRQVRKEWSKAAASWEQHESSLLYFTGGVDPVLLPALGLAPGQRVLDLGCGPGEPALTIARWIAPRGRVLGIDISAPMLAVARRRARVFHVTNARFRAGDLERMRLRPRSFDRVVGRFSLMFVADVAATLERVHGLLARGGRAAFAVWGPESENPHFQIVARAVRPLLREPPPDPETIAHPLRLWRPGRLARLMREAGFRGVRVAKAWSAEVHADPDSYTRERFDSSVSIARILKDLSPHGRAALYRRVRNEAARHRSGGIVRLLGMAWVVSGRV